MCRYEPAYKRGLAWLPESTHINKILSQLDPGPVYDSPICTYPLIIVGTVTDLWSTFSDISVQTVWQLEIGYR